MKRRAAANSLWEVRPARRPIPRSGSVHQLRPESIGRAPLRTDQGVKDPSKQARTLLRFEFIHDRYGGGRLVGEAHAPRLYLRHHPEQPPCGNLSVTEQAETVSNGVLP